MFRTGQRLKEKRDSVIMACLRGGQHIDAALEAAEKLVPQSSVDKAFEEDAEMMKKYQDIIIEAYNNRSKRYEDTEPDISTTQPWCASVISRWWPF